MSELDDAFLNSKAAGVPGVRDALMSRPPSRTEDVPIPSLGQIITYGFWQDNGVEIGAQEIARRPIETPQAEQGADLSSKLKSVSYEKRPDGKIGVHVESKAGRSLDDKIAARLGGAFDPALSMAIIPSESLGKLFGEDHAQKIAAGPFRGTLDEADLKALPRAAQPETVGPEMTQPEPDPATGEAIKDIGKGAIAGVEAAAMEILKTTRLDKLADWLQENYPLPEIAAPQPKTGAGEITKGVTQGIAGMIPAARVTRALQAVSGFLRWTTAGALTDFAAFSPDDPGIGDLAKELDKLDSQTLEQVRSTVADALAKNASDNELKKRLKNVGGGILAGTTIDGLQRLYRAAKSIPPESRKALIDMLKSFAKDESGMVTWHGSPHTFGKFSLEKVGTGEGAQVYGWGLYFAGKKEVAEYYRTALSNRRPAKADALIRFWASHKDSSGKLLGRDGDSFWPAALRGDISADEFTGAARREFQTIMAAPDKVQGRLYKVDLAPKEDEYLYWDKPLSEQSEKVKAALGKYRNRWARGAMESDPSGAAIYDKLSDGFLRSRQEAQKATSLLLKDSGIPGIKYLDQGSRSDGEGTYNYVLFDDRAVKILEMHGFTGGAGAAAVLSSGAGPQGAVQAAAPELSGAPPLQPEPSPGDAGGAGSEAALGEPRPSGDLAPVQIAGVSSKIIQEILKGGRGRVPATKAPSGAVADVTKTAVHLRPASTDEAMDLLNKMGVVNARETVDFNLDHLHSFEDVKAVINAASELLAPQIDQAKRGVVKHEATKEMAEQLDILPEVLGRRVGEIFNAEQMVAARMLLQRSAKRVDELAKKAVGVDATERDMLEFRRMMALHATVQMQVKGAQTEIARALSSFNIDVGPGVLEERRVRDLLQSFGGPETARDMARKYLELGDEVARNKFASGTALAKTKDVVFEIWINGLLSSPLSHMRNTVGNALFQAWSIPEYALAAGIGAARQGGRTAMDTLRSVFGYGAKGPVTDRVFLGEVGADMYGWVAGLNDAFVLAWRALKTGEPTDVLGKIEATQHRAISAETFGLVGPTGKAVDYLGEVIRVPGRFLMAEDEFFKTIASRRELNRLAYRTAMQKRLMGASEDEARDAAVQILRDPPEDIRMSVEDAARYFTFTDEPTGAVLGRLNDTIKAVQQVPIAGRVVMPFRRTPLNIMSAFSERSPLAFTSPNFYEAIRAGGVKRDLAIAKLSLGSGAMAIAGTWALEGRITGGGPTNDKQKAMLRETGWQPWSLVFQKGEIGEDALKGLKAAGLVNEYADKVYVNYLGIEPLGNFLAVAAGVADIMKWSDDFSHNEDLATAVVQSIAEMFEDRSFFQGFADISHALQFGPNAINQYLSRLGGTAKPFSMLIKRMEALADPTARDVRVDPDIPIGLSQAFAVMHGWMDATPGLSSRLPPKRNIWGEEVKLGEGKWWEFVNPFYMREEKYSDVEKELVRLGGVLSLPGREIAGVKLKPEQYSRFVELQGGEIEIAGRTQKEAMRDLIDSARYKNAEDDDKARFVQNMHKSYIDAAKRVLAGVRPKAGGGFTVDPGIAEDIDLALKIQDALTLKDFAPARELPQGVK